MCSQSLQHCQWTGKREREGLENDVIIKGCAECACDPTGVEMDHEGKPDLQCNHFDGQCKCKVSVPSLLPLPFSSLSQRGRGGRTCSECEDYFWGDPTTPDGCKMCECDRTGSMSLQCHRNNGTCVCQEGSGE